MENPIPSFSPDNGAAQVSWLPPRGVSEPIGTERESPVSVRRRAEHTQRSNKCSDAGHASTIRSRFVKVHLAGEEGRQSTPWLRHRPEGSGLAPDRPQRPP